MNLLIIKVILPYILLYKYWALFVLTFFASLIIPIPAGTLLVVSSALAIHGYFNITKLIIIVIIANFIGDNLSYWLSRLYGKKILSHVKFFKRILDSKNFKIVETSINKHTGLFILISRFEVISTLTANAICGLSKTPYKKFIIYEIIGTFANVLFYATIGYMFGDNWQIINKIMGDFTILFFLIIVICISIFWKKMMKKMSY